MKLVLCLISVIVLLGIVKTDDVRRKRDVKTCSVKLLDPSPVRKFFLVEGDAEKELSADADVESGKVVAIHFADDSQGSVSWTCGADGKWSIEPTCGSGPIDGQRTGTVIVSPNIAWFATIFRKNSTTGAYDEHCSGTILSKKLVVSAMACFWDSVTDKEIPLNELKVAIGNTSYNSPEEIRPNSLTLSIQKVLYENDTHDIIQKDRTVVLLLLSEPIQYQTNIYPVCVEYGDSGSVLDGYLQGRIGVWATWGRETLSEKDEQALAIAEFKNPQALDCKPNTSTVYVGEKKICREFLIAQNIRTAYTGAGIFATNPNAEKRNKYSLEGILTHHQAGENVVFVDIQSLRQFLLKTSEKYESK